MKNWISVVILSIFLMTTYFSPLLEESGPSEIRFEVWDHDIGKDEPMGFAVFDLLKVRTPKIFLFFNTGLLLWPMG
jgi:hypothetical protein